MTKQEKISEWFDLGEDFLAGLALLAVYGDVPPYYTAYKNTPYRPPSILAALRYDMNKAAFSPPFTPIRHTEHTPNPYAYAKKEAIPLHKRHAVLHAQLQLLQTAEERYPLIVELMCEVLPTLDRIYAAARSTKPEAQAAITATAPEDVIAIRVDAVKKFQDYLNVQSRITKLNGKNGIIATEQNLIRQAKLKNELAEKQQLCASIASYLHLKPTDHAEP
jgi:hypothetical protein